MKSYTFKVVLEKDKWPDEPDKQAVWRAYIPLLEHKGAASWGETQQEALVNLSDALELVIEDMIERGEPIPEEPRSQVKISKEPLLSVNI